VPTRAGRVIRALEFEVATSECSEGNNRHRNFEESNLALPSSGQTPCATACDSLWQQVLADSGSDRHPGSGNH
jgi:hypothetical protein